MLSLSFRRFSPFIASIERRISVRNKSDTLLGSVNYYNKHIFVPVAGSAADWPAKLEKSDDPNHSLFAKLSRMIKDREMQNIQPTFQVSAIESTNSSGTSCDALVLPDGLKVQFNQNNIEEVLQKLSDNKLEITAANKKHIFICAHAKRDQRCADCGPPIYDELLSELRKANIQDVDVHKCSHVGGHRWAGNVIIFDSNGGNWYGCVKKENVAELVQEHLVNNNIVWRFWRGKTGLTPEETVAVYEKHK